MGQEPRRDRWLGENSEEWVGAEGAVGLGPKQSARLRRAQRNTTQLVDWLFLSAAFLTGIALGASVCSQVKRRAD